MFRDYRQINGACRLLHIMATDIRTRIADLGRERAAKVAQRDKLKARRRELLALRRLSGLSDKQKFELDSIGAQVSDLLAAEREIGKALAALVAEATVRHGLTDAECADLARVERMTVLTWLGKRSRTTTYVPAQGSELADEDEEEAVTATT